MTRAVTAGGSTGLRAVPLAVSLAVLGLAAAGLPAAAQPPDPFSGQVSTPIGPALPTPSVTGPNLPPTPAENATDLYLSSVFSGSGQPIRSGLAWRVFEDRGDDGRPAVVARSNEANPTFHLPPGAYLATVTYGYASATKRVALSGTPVSEQLRVSAGALKLYGAVGDQKIPPAQIAFSVFVPIGTNMEGRLVREGVKAGELVRLPEGTYHVVSTYGESNAIQRADLRVENGKVTDATLNHRAATVTLKLVAAPGAEAFAGTAFSVLTPGGDTIREAIGAFPSVTLAEGDYVLIARHDGQVYTREFKVESGMDRDIEVVAKGS
ncbi:hypothetical protein [Methylobacterium organophilum]|uniref:Uncharacterized protein n=1 Tax=Methylobacterium organophilum TaxID=410 RepID=A0ABQ4T7X6_METOR|nr:hypothetical protein [Methylobacterium organophilum]UMY17262.1 hypothetical protein MMB17_21930 [Methylobacterium organophilum]GJE26702.1 hypothetical protein LKMONMHP_1553 [Methylobacterium organophilum]